MKRYYENLKLTPLVSQVSWTNNLIILSGNRSDEEKNDEIVEYALSRSLSPTVIANYETELIPKKLLKQKIDELCRFYGDEE